MRDQGKSSRFQATLAKGRTNASTSEASGGICRLGLIALALLGLLLTAAPAAMAAPTAQPGFGYEGTTAEFGGLFSGPARNPVAVDGDGRVFVGQGLGFDFPKNEPIPALVVVFAAGATAGSAPLTTIDLGSLGISPTDLAIDQSNDALYVQDKEHGTITRFTSDGQPTPTYTVDPSFQLLRGESIAVDPTSGDLLAADPGVSGVLRYDSTGTLVETIATAPISSPQRIAAAPDGSFFVAEDGNPDVLRFSGAGSLLETVSGVGAIQALTTDPANGRLVASVGPTIKVYSLAGTFLSEAVSPNADDNGIAVDGGSSRLYGFVPTGNSAHLNTYAPAVWPGIEGFAPVEVTAHTARFSAEVDPGAGAGSEAHLEYSADGGNNWKSAPSQPVSGPATIESELTALLADFDYQVRLVVSNSLTSHTTPPVTIHTTAIAPEVVTAPATDITETSAVLNGTINPSGRQTTYHFEYGTTSAYGSRIPVAIDAVADATYDSRTFSRTIPGLVPGATYHFRIVAQNALGTSFGEDRTFTTTAAGAAIKRAYEQVTPIDKGGRPLTTHFAFQPKADGSGLVYAFRGAERGSPINSFQISSRGSTDWHSTDLSVPLNGIGPHGAVQQTSMAVSGDFSKQLVATNKKLTPEATEGGTNIYLVDIATKTYTFVATNAGLNFGEGLESFVAIQQGADKFIAGAPDFSWVVFKSIPPLIPGTPQGALYRWSEGKGLEVVSLLPGGASEPVVVPVSIGATVRWVSADGSRIYFQTGAGPFNGPIYLREGDQPAKAISVSQIEGDSTAPRVGQFFGTSKDGRYAFFMSAEGKLTPDAPEPVEPAQEGGVYRYDALSESLEYLGAEASRFSYSDPLGVGDDGRTAYFHSPANVAVAWRDGVVKQASPSRLFTAVMSPNGRYLAFERAGDVYLFDAEDGTRSCASCLPDGGSGEASLLFGERAISNRYPNPITNAGQVFYTAGGRLVAADANAKKDAYEYYDGRNTLISPGNAPFDAIVADISEDGSSVFFSTGQKLVGQDNDESSDFYVARVGGGLASQNPPPPKVCIRDDCKATPAPGPEVPFGGSEAIRGSENVTPKARCKKGRHARKVKGKTRCVKSSKAKKKQKKTNSHRRQGR